MIGAFDTTIPVSGGGWSITSPYTLEDLDEAETIIVPVWPQPFWRRRRPSCSTGCGRRTSGARLVSVCTGAFLLAQTGLLDGRRATTHWMWAADLAKRYPEIDVDPDVLFVDAGHGISPRRAPRRASTCACTSCGSTTAPRWPTRWPAAWWWRLSATAARPSSSSVPVARACSDDPIARVLDWALEHLDQPLTVEDLAVRALLSPRSFARRFRAATGTTPMQWLLRQRVLHAQRLLETTDLPVERVSQRCGFGTATALRVHFRRIVGTTPVAYRRTFGPDADVVSSPAIRSTTSQPTGGRRARGRHAAPHRRSAAPALAGKRLARFEAPRLRGDRPRPGDAIEAVHAQGKHLLIDFAGGLTLRTHLRMNGMWHLYRTGERWQRGPQYARAVVETDDGWCAVCFAAPDGGDVPSPSRAPAALARLGTRPVRARGRPRRRPPPVRGLDQPEDEIGDVLMDQRIAAGIGNMHKSEACFACGIDPFTPVANVPDEARRRLYAAAHRNLRSHPGHAVYGRAGRPCPRCGTPVKRRRQGPQARSTYWCPRCQAPPME